jgi:OmpA-OmpF porin, OOP family
MTKYTRHFLGLVAAAAMAAGSGYALPSASPQGQQPAVQQTQGNPTLDSQARQNSESTLRLAVGQKTKIEGVIQRRDAGSLMVRDTKGGNYLITLGGNTQIREKKSNPFRGAKAYAQQQLLQGMMVEVEGRGGETGNVVADRIRFTNSDLRVAEAINTRVSPVEQDVSQTAQSLSQTSQSLSQTTQRVGLAEQNAQRMSGQISELSAVSNAARGGAKAAQESADAARQSADNANAGVHAANERISSIDDYRIKNSIVVNFKAGSTVLSKEAQAELDQIADLAKDERAFVIEVTGYASAEGSKALNQRLSQRRADEVIRYLAQNYDIPIRRFITPMGLGTSRPVADNGTRVGRTENRRVEIKVLVSRGLQGQGNVQITGSIQ